MAALRKPKKLKLPKKPKRGASIATMEAYLDKVKHVHSENKKRLSDYEKNKKKRESLRNQIAGLKRK